MTLDPSWWPFAAFWLVLFVAAGAEAALPLYRNPVETNGRLATNFGLGLVNAAFVAFVPFSTALLAAWAESEGIGFMNWLRVPTAAAVVLTILSFSLTAYGVHRLEHRVPLLWRIHRVHHSDTAMDVSTGFRHHPAGLLVTLAVAGSLALALGWSAPAIIAYATVAAVFSLVTHVNLRLPHWLDVRLRWLLVTPEMHHVHHSSVRAETDSNYSDVFSIWDHLFGTYRHLSREELRAMRFGLGDDQDSRAGNIAAQLASPFRNDPAQPEVLPGAVASRG